MHLLASRWAKRTLRAFSYSASDFWLIADAPLSPTERYFGGVRQLFLKALARWVGVPACRRPIQPGHRPSAESWVTNEGSHEAVFTIKVLLLLVFVHARRGIETARISPSRGRYRFERRRDATRYPRASRRLDNRVGNLFGSFSPCSSSSSWSWECSSSPANSLRVRCLQGGRSMRSAWRRIDRLGKSANAGWKNPSQFQRTARYDEREREGRPAIYSGRQAL
jgi:hypothetical protein